MSDCIAFLPSPRSLGIGATLRVDQVTVELVRATRMAVVECILLKGPSFARWLYQDRPRPYTDADLLVSPESRRRAEQVLLEIGFNALPAVIRGDPSRARGRMVV